MSLKTFYQNIYLSLVGAKLFYIHTNKEIFRGWVEKEKETNYKKKVFLNKKNIDFT